MGAFQPLVKIPFQNIQGLDLQPQFQIRRDLEELARAIVAAGRSPFTMVAANNATALEKSLADFICSGSADEVVINQALATGKIVILSSGTYLTAASIVNPAGTPGMIIGSGSGILGYTSLNLQGTGNATDNGNTAIDIGHGLTMMSLQIAVAGSNNNIFYSSSTNNARLVLQDCDINTFHGRHLLDSFGAGSNKPVLTIRDCLLQAQNFGTAPGLATYTLNSSFLSNINGFVDATSPTTIATSMITNIGQIPFIDGGNNMIDTASAQGVATLAFGSATVNTTAIKSTSKVKLAYAGPSANAGAVFESARTAGVSFAITSTNAADTSKIFWEIQD